MKKLGFNPYLPSWEFVPDGEPHVFDGRVYIYGSHDRRGGSSFCEDDYVVWSAPVDDLGDWRCEGVSYRKMQDPLNGAPYDGILPKIDMPLGTKDNPHMLYAPDVAKGVDGRYYLYYALDFTNVISVAVSDSPAGPYEFLDFVRTMEGEIPAKGRCFDPAILCEESGNYLYYGFAPQFKFPGMEDIIFPGAMVVKLADDMHTVISKPICIANGIDTAVGTSYEEHPFFEASSIRRIGGWYYFVYSSLQGNELCYGMSKSPTGPFEFKGVIVSNGDLGYNGNTLPVNYTGNNHGGLVEINDDVYIFWHRQTHGNEFSRQGCADKVHIADDGTISQIEITSCGLNNAPLPAKHHYQTYIACHLTEKDRTKVGHVANAGPGETLPKLPEEMPFITEEECESGEKGLKPYIKNMREGAVAGFKYFSFDGTENSVSLEIRGNGAIEIVLDDIETGTVVARIENKADNESWKNIKTALSPTKGSHALYFCTRDGALDFASFEIK